MALLTTLFTAVGFLLVILGVPLIQRRIRPNLFYGLRVPATLRDEWVWYEANAASGRDLVTLGIAQAALAMILSIGFHVPAATYTLANASFLLLATLCFAAIGWRRANWLLRSRRAAQP